MKLLVFGFGFTGQALARLRPDGWRIAGVSRDPERRRAMADQDVVALDPTDTQDLPRALAETDALLIAAPPDAEGCPGLRTLAPLLDRNGRAPPWIGYLSTTGVYGDRDGGWVFEDSELRPVSPEAERRVGAELEWAELAKRSGAHLATFRLPGIYGPGRSPLDRVRAGDARRLIKPGHVFSRIHVDDLALALTAAVGRPDCAGVYNLCDDLPAAASDVTAYAAGLLGVQPPPEEPYDPATLSPMARRFWSETKRVSNAKAKAALGWRPMYPTYREGLAAVLAAERLNAG
ncbi:SDR family oxidoreductase [Caulobacter sp. S45]|uniref:SDR family oxidoreductase n=1 Tax=Caulobacter sp. S45 TaxID=1641861 RepID=UPI00131B1C6A|nr:SDR family oxidoreductase [Caulobacter sp. S45]